MKKFIPYIIVGVLILAIVIIYAKKRNQAADQKAVEEMAGNGSAGFVQPSSGSTFVATCDCESRPDIQEGITAYRNMHPDFPYKQAMYNRVLELCPCAKL